LTNNYGEPNEYIQKFQLVFYMNTILDTLS